ncbi:MAG: hypothetical protein ACLQVX_05435 [Limisphaerales bacterium]
MKVLFTILWAMLSVAPVTGAAEFFFGEDVSPYPVGSPPDMPRPTSFPMSMSAYSNFVARLAEQTNHGEIQTFENYTSNSFYFLPSIALINYGTVGGNVYLNYLDASKPDLLNSICWFEELTEATAMDTGTFPISGTNYLEIQGLSSAPHLAFGLLGGTTTGFGLFITGLRSTNLLVTVGFSGESFVLPVTVPQGPGGVCFFGAVADEFSYVDLQMLAGTAEPFGIDNLMIAVPGLPDGAVPAGPATLRMDPGDYGIWIEGTVGAHYQIEFSPQCLSQAVWRPFADFVLPQSPYYVQAFNITNSTAFFRAVGLDQ